MKTIRVLTAVLALTVNSRGSLHDYPTRIRPAISLEDALAVSKLYLAREKISDYYVVSAMPLGDKEQTGAGAWNIVYATEKSGTVIAFSIHFPEPDCSVSNSDETQRKHFKRNGNKLAD